MNIILLSVVTLIAASVFARLLVINPFRRRDLRRNLSIKDWAYFYITRHYGVLLGSKTLYVDAIAFVAICVSTSDLTMIPEWGNVAIQIAVANFYLYLITSFVKVLHYSKQMTHAIEEDDADLFTQYLAKLEALGQFPDDDTESRFSNTSIAPYTVFTMLNNNKNPRIFGCMLRHYIDSEVGIRMQLKDYFFDFDLAPITNIDPQWPDTTKRIALSITPEEKTTKPTTWQNFPKYTTY